MTTKFVIYWEKNKERCGFVSYNNKHLEIRDEYDPVCFFWASKYKTRKLAERTRNWYNSRGGFGDFIIMEVKE